MRYASLHPLNRIVRRIIITNVLSNNAVLGLIEVIIHTLYVPFCYC